MLFIYISLASDFKDYHVMQTLAKFKFVTGNISKYKLNRFSEICEIIITDARRLFYITISTAR